MDKLHVAGMLAGKPSSASAKPTDAWEESTTRSLVSLNNRAMSEARMRHQKNSLATEESTVLQGPAESVQTAKRSDKRPESAFTAVSSTHNLRLKTTEGSATSKKTRPQPQEHSRLTEFPARPAKENPGFPKSYKPCLITTDQYWNPDQAKERAREALVEADHIGGFMETRGLRRAQSLPKQKVQLEGQMDCDQFFGSVVSKGLTVSRCTVSDFDEYPELTQDPEKVPQIAREALLRQGRVPPRSEHADQKAEDLREAAARLRARPAGQDFRSPAIRSPR